MSEFKQVLVLGFVTFCFTAGTVLGVQYFGEAKPFGEQCRPDNEQRKLMEIKQIIQRWELVENES
jgi:hypothetical protein